MRVCVHCSSLLYTERREREREMGDCNCKRMAAMDDSATGVSKRRKFKASSSPHKQRLSHSEAPLPPSPPMLHLRHSHSPQLLNSSDSWSSFCSDHSPPSSCCSSNELNDVVVAHSSPLLDLEVNLHSLARTELPIFLCYEMMEQKKERETSG